MYYTVTSTVLVATATSSSVGIFHGTSYPASNAVDGRIDTFTASAGGDTDPWVRIDLQVAYCITAVEVTSRRGYGKC